MTIFQSKDFATRSQLENKIRQEAGGDTSPKPDFEIQGTKDELNKLNLSESSNVFGVRCVILN